MKKRSKKEQDSLESKQTPPRDNGSSISQDTQTTSSSQRSKTARKINVLLAFMGIIQILKTPKFLKAPRHLKLIQNTILTLQKTIRHNIRYGSLEERSIYKKRVS